MSLYLYNLTLLKSGLISNGICGSFSGPDVPEVLVVRGKTLELLRLSEPLGKLISIVSIDVFSTIRSLASFRSAGNDRDYVVVGSDSGKLVVLEYNEQENQFESIVEETVGRPGCLRTVPGQYVTADPKGKCLLISAIESKQLVYSFHQTKSKLSINGPIEINSPGNIIFDVTGIETSSKNPIFASLELGYEHINMKDPSESFKTVKFHKVDWDRNETSIKSTLKVDRSAYKIVSIPNEYGFGSVIILAKDKVIYKSIEHEQEIIVSIPKRKHTISTSYDGSNDNGVYFLSCIFHRDNDSSFFLLHSEFGDVFKLTLTASENQVTDIQVDYIDTTPPSTFICTFSKPYVFTASESGNHLLYSVKGGFQSQPGYIEDDNGQKYLTPAPLRNFTLEDELKSTCPIVDIKVDNIFSDETQQIISLGGRGPRSTLRVMIHGIETDVILNQNIKEDPLSVWTLKESANDEMDKYIVISYPDSTLVLSIGDTIDIIQDNENIFETNEMTLNVGLFGNGHLQILPNLVKYIRGGKSQEWKPPSGKTIIHASSNEKQFIVALNGGDIVYFELDGTKFKEIETIATGNEVLQTAIQPIHEGEQKGTYIAVSDSDSRLRIYNVGNGEQIQATSSYHLPSKSQSLSFLSLFNISEEHQYIVSGSINGILTRLRIDEEGLLTDAHSKFIGTKSIRLSPIRIGGLPALLCASKRTWILYVDKNLIRLTPLSCGSLENAAPLSFQQSPDSIIGISKNALKIFIPEHISDIFTHMEMPLRYTPRQSTIIPTTKNMVVVEADHNAYSHLALTEIQKDQTIPVQENVMEIEDQPPLSSILPSLTGVPKPGPGKWGSCIRVIDLLHLDTLDLIELENNEAALSVCHTAFRDHGNEIFVCVGIAKDLVLYPKRSCKVGYIHVYRFVEDGKKLELMTRLEVDGLPTALAPYQGRLLVGIGNSLSIYDLGKLKNDLVKKCESNAFPNVIVNITSFGERIIVGDIQESFHFVKYNRPDC